jgi:hypothetical protein
MVPFKSGYFVAQGEHNSDLSVSSSLFCDYPSQFEWKFELNLFMGSSNFTTTTSLLVYVNHPPKSGSCNIEPKNGTTSTLFNIYCDSWIDEVGHVAAFSFYGLTFLFIFSKLIVLRFLWWTSIVMITFFLPEIGDRPVPSPGRHITVLSNAVPLATLLRSKRLPFLQCP